MIFQLPNKADIKLDKLWLCKKIFWFLRPCLVLIFKNFHIMFPYMGERCVNLAFHIFNWRKIFIFRYVAGLYKEGTQHLTDTVLDNALILLPTGSNNCVPLTITFPRSHRHWNNERVKPLKHSLRTIMGIRIFFRVLLN